MDCQEQVGLEVAVKCILLNCIQMLVGTLYSKHMPSWSLVHRTTRSLHAAANEL